MNVLVTAGNTLALIDQVRCITNIFTGRTGAAIALEAQRRGHAVTLLTSHPETAVALAERGAVRPYRTFEDLQSRMKECITTGEFDVVVHCAAVSDYLSSGVYSPAEGCRFDPASGVWQGEARLNNQAAGKVKSDEPELWLRLVRAPKLVDCIRKDWGYRGLLVKFKLEVGLSDEQLLQVAERSRAHSDADLMVANTLEGSPYYAFVGSGTTGYERVSRGRLAARLLEVVESMHRSRE
jgi:phosphopantothenate-cysteine ligase/phosphopantothenoylcysteine decarboxylase/phosphopantothenate--cysteine ligase